jgi:hypothetical protein
LKLVIINNNENFVGNKKKKVNDTE